MKQQGHICVLKPGHQPLALELLQPAGVTPEAHSFQRDMMIGTGLCEGFLTPDTDQVQVLH